MVDCLQVVCFQLIHKNCCFLSEILIQLLEEKSDIPVKDIFYLYLRPLSNW